MNKSFWEPQWFSSVERGLALQCSELSYCLQSPASHVWILVRVPTAVFQYRSILMCLERQGKMARVCKLLPPTWESQFLSPGFSLDQPWLFQAWTHRRALSISPSFFSFPFSSLTSFSLLFFSFPSSFPCTVHSLNIYAFHVNLKKRK